MHFEPSADHLENCQFQSKAGMVVKKSNKFSCVEDTLRDEWHEDGANPDRTRIPPAELDLSTKKG